MKSNVVILNILGIYFVFVAAVYTVWNIIATGTVEWAGSVAILLSAGLVWLISFYLGRLHKSQGGELRRWRDHGRARSGYLAGSVGTPARSDRSNRLGLRVLPRPLRSLVSAHAHQTG